jgi:hypothetical protein
MCMVARARFVSQMPKSTHAGKRAAAREPAAQNLIDLCCSPPPARPRRRRHRGRSLLPPFNRLHVATEPKLFCRWPSAVDVATSLTLPTTRSSGSLFRSSRPTSPSGVHPARYGSSEAGEGKRRIQPVGVCVDALGYESFFY